MRLQLRNFMAGFTCLRTAMAFGLLIVVLSGHAQDLEPRAYANTPVGMNFLLLGYQYSEGDLLFDPTVPITDANARVDMGFLGFVHALGIADKSAKVGVILPVARLDADGFVEGVFRTREDNGLVDPRFYFSINLYGAPALSFEEFKDYQQDTIIGFTLKVSAPYGSYNNDRLLNIGTNTWSFKPELGLSQAIGRWTLEAAAAATIYTDNTDFDNGKTRQRDTIYSAQGHVIYAFPGNVWASIGATYYAGGRTTIDGVARNDLQQNWRAGFTLALPINRSHSIKLFGNSGVSTRTGTDYDVLGVAWQYRWGGGF